MSDVVPSGETLKQAYAVERHLSTNHVSETYALSDPLKTRTLIGLRVVPQLARCRGYLAWFEDNARRLLAIRHRSLAAVIDYVVESPERCFLVLEEPIGHTLRGELTLPRQQTPLPRPLSFARSQSIYRQIAEALDALHQGHCLHLDLRPENVILHNAGDDSVQVTLLGMGIVSPLLWQTTECPDALLPYQTPEQLSREPVGEKSDLFTFASLIYEMLKGAQAFRRQSDDREAVLYKIEREDPIPFAAPLQAVPGFSRALNKAFYKSPQQRHGSIRDFCQELGIAFSEPSTPPKPQPPHADKGRLGWLVAGCALGGALAAYFLLGMGGPGGDQPPDGGIGSVPGLAVGTSEAPGKEPPLPPDRVPDKRRETKPERNPALTPDPSEGSPPSKPGSTPGKAWQLADRVDPSRSAVPVGTSPPTDKAGTGGGRVGLPEGLGGGSPGRPATPDPRQVGGGASEPSDLRVQTKPLERTPGTLLVSSALNAIAGSTPPAPPDKPATGRGRTGPQKSSSAGAGHVESPGKTKEGSGRTSEPTLTSSPGRGCAQSLRYTPDTISAEQKRTLAGCLELLTSCTGMPEIHLHMINNHYSVSSNTHISDKRAGDFRECIRSQIPPTPTIRRITIKKED